MFGAGSAALRRKGWDYQCLGWNHATVPLECSSVAAIVVGTAGLVLVLVTASVDGALLLTLAFRFADDITGIGRVVEEKAKKEQKNEKKRHKVSLHLSGDENHEK